MRVFLYDEGSCPALRAEELAAEVARLTGADVEVRGEFVRCWAEKGDTIPFADVGKWYGVPLLPPFLPQALARARVVDPLSRLQPEREPTPVEIAAERRVLDTPGKASVGILYDAAVVQWLMAELMANKGDTIPIQDVSNWYGVPFVSIILTGRLLGTFMSDDRRWHAHTVMLGEPALISTSGLVQAPARPREYYQGQALATSRLVPREVVEAELQRRLADRLLLPDDPRITAAAVGCALQAIAFHVTGEAFCPEPTCRLHNARTQEELIRCQCSKEAGLCARHEALFRSMREGVYG